MNSTTVMNSALYSGWVQHRRFAPRLHNFRYRMGLLYLDLSEQEAVLALSPLAGRGRFAPFAFRETDYLPQFTGAGIALIDAVRQRVGEALGNTPLGHICLLTTGHQHVAVAKAFHVSPFLPRDLEYRMSFSPAGERLGIHMADWQGEEKLFDASLSLQRTELNRASLHRYLLQFPWMTGKTVAAIYWQALRLLLKRIPLFTHRAAEGDFRVARPASKEVPHEKL